MSCACRLTCQEGTQETDFYDLLTISVTLFHNSALIIHRINTADKSFIEVLNKFYNIVS